VFYAASAYCSVADVRTVFITLYCRRDASNPTFRKVRIHDVTQPGTKQRSMKLGSVSDELHCTVHMLSSHSSSSMNCRENDGSSEYISSNIDVV